MYLSYTGYSIARACLFRYWHMYINHTVAMLPDDRLGSIFGTVVGKLFEAFYQEKLWKKGKAARKILESRVEAYVDQALLEATTATDWREAGIIVWKDNTTNPRGIYYNKKELIADVRHAIPRGLTTIKEHGFLGKDAVAEMYLNTVIEGQKFGGRADFVMTLYRSGELVILDGKGSRGVDKDKYTDPTQLLWYTLLLLEKHGKFPDWTGFVYWKKEPPHNVSRHVFTRQDTQKLKDTVLALMASIEEKTASLPDAPERVSLDVVREVFPPNPDESNCRFCPYAADGVCNGGAEVVRKIEQRYQNR